jgi:hypothetical protein
MVVERQPDLSEVVFALHPPGGLAGLLDRGQEQRDQDGDDRDDDQQFDEREAPSPRGTPVAAALNGAAESF